MVVCFSTGGTGAPVIAATTIADPIDDKGFECLIEPNVVTAVGTAVQGIVRRVDVQRGDYVERGAALIVLDAKDQVLNLELATKRASMKSEIAAHEAEVTLAKLNLDRVKSLRADEMVPKQVLDEAVATLQLANSARQQARDNQALLDIERDRARVQLEHMIIRSPISGLVTEQVVYEGEFVRDQPLMRISQIDPLRVDVVLPGTMFGTVEVGDPVEVHPEIPGNERLISEVERVDRFLDPRSGTFNVLLRLPNADLSIISGQNCFVEFLESANAALHQAENEDEH